MSQDKNRDSKGRFAVGNDLGIRFSEDYKPQTKYNEQEVLEIGEELIEWMSDYTTDRDGKPKNLLFKDWLIEQGYYDELLAYWANRWPSFLKLLLRAHDIQEQKILRFGLTDKLNANFAKFVLVNKYKQKGYLSTRSREELTGADGEQLFKDKTDDELKQELARLRAKTQ